MILKVSMIVSAPISVFIGYHEHVFEKGEQFFLSVITNLGLVFGLYVATLFVLSVAMYFAHDFYRKVTVYSHRSKMIMLACFIVGAALLVTL